MGKIVEELKGLIEGKSKIQAMLRETEAKTTLAQVMAEAIGKQADLPEAVVIISKLFRKLEDSRKQILEEGLKLIETKLEHYEQILDKKAS